MDIALSDQRDGGKEKRGERGKGRGIKEEKGGLRGNEKGKKAG